MAKGRQTKTVARITINASVVDLHGQQVLVWGVTKPHNLAADKPGTFTSYSPDMQAAVTEACEWLAKHYPGIGGGS